jgi:hypothetical protein
MGGSAKRVIAVVAAIAIPYLAPKIAPLVFTSGAVSAAAANTITGAALGFGVAKATGGDPLIGAIGGGAGGYFSGGGGDIFGPGTSAGTSSIDSIASGFPGDPMNPMTTTLAPADYSLTGGTAAPTTIPMTTTLAPADYSLTGGLAAPSSGLSFGGAEGLQAAAFDVAPSAASLSTTAATDFGAQLSGAAPGAAGFTPVDYGITGAPPSASTAATTFAPADYSLSGTAAGVPSAAAPGAGLATGSAMGSAPGSGISTTATGADIAPTTLGEKAWAFTKSVGGDLLKTAAVLTAIGQPDIPGEIPADLLAQYEQDFARLAQENPAAYQAKLQEAQKFLQMASTFDPQYFGQEEARKAQIRGARAKREGLRGLTGRQRAAAERQFDLETGRSAGTSYTQGAQRALTGQIQTQEAGLKLMPRPSEYTLTGAYGDLGNIYAGQATARRQYTSDIGDLADQATSIYNKGRDIFSS